MQEHETPFHGDLIAATSNEQRVSATVAISEEATRILEQLVLLHDDKCISEPSGQLFLERAIDFLRAKLITHEFTLRSFNSPAARRGLATWQVRRVTNYMRDRIDQRIGLNELASLANLSRFHFCTAFRIATGRTPYEWLTHERVARAKHLLGDPTLSITDIALAVGYSTPSAFASVFRKVMGQTPTEFRRRL